MSGEPLTPAVSRDCGASGSCKWALRSRRLAAERARAHRPPLDAAIPSHPGSTHTSTDAPPARARSLRRGDFFAHRRRAAAATLSVPCAHIVTPRPGFKHSHHGAPCMQRSSGQIELAHGRAAAAVQRPLAACPLAPATPTRHHTARPCHRVRHVPGRRRSLAGAPLPSALTLALGTAPDVRPQHALRHGARSCACIWGSRLLLLPCCPQQTRDLSFPSAWLNPARFWYPCTPSPAPNPLCAHCIDAI